jgi:hypothetical protein
LPSLVVQKKSLSGNMCAVKAAVLTIELAVTAVFIFLCSRRRISKLVFFVIVVVVVYVLPFFLFGAFVSFDGLTFKDEFGLRSESGDVPIKVKLLPPSRRKPPLEEAHDLLVCEFGSGRTKWKDGKAIVNLCNRRSGLSSR